MSCALVNRIIDSSVVDGPGNRTAIFLQGCNFHCLYCHNPETMQACRACGECVPHCPAGALSMAEGRVLWDERRCLGCDECLRHCRFGSTPRAVWRTAREIAEHVRVNLPFIRGVTVSGGECTLQAAFLRELFGLTKELGLTNLIDSNGSYPLLQDEVLMRVCDGVLLDVKAADPEAHRLLTGSDNKAVWENLDGLAAAGKLAEIRTVIAADMGDAENTVRSVAWRLADTGHIDVPYRLIRYRPFGVRLPYRDQFSVPIEDEMRRLVQLAHSYGLGEVTIL